MVFNLTVIITVAAILILLWTAVVGMMYYAVISLIAMFVVIYPYNNKLTVHHALCYAVLAVVMMFYPLSGFIADLLLCLHKTWLPIKRP